MPHGAQQRASGQFVQTRPLDGVPATEQTEVYIAYDSQRLYFGIYAHYSNPSLVRANRVDRDRTENDDTVTVFFDPFLDQQSGYSMSVNGYGVQGDSLVRGTGGFGGQGVQSVEGDTSWNASVPDRPASWLKTAGPPRWSFPFKSLRYPARGGGEAHRWGFQVQREIQGKNETVVWAPISRDISGFLRQMGLLEGMSNLSTSRNLELLPSFTAVQAGRLDSKTGALQPGRFGRGGHLPEVRGHLEPDVGLHLQSRLLPDRIRPPADRSEPAVSGQLPGAASVLPRGAGQLPTGGACRPDGSHADDRRPTVRRKLTGKMGRVTMGFLMARDQAPGRVDDRSDPAFGRTAQVVAGRAMYELLSGTYARRNVHQPRVHERIQSSLRLRSAAPAGIRSTRDQVKGAFTDHRRSKRRPQDRPLERAQPAQTGAKLQLHAPSRRDRTRREDGPGIHPAGRRAQYERDCLIQLVAGGRDRELGSANTPSTGITTLRGNLQEQNNGMGLSFDFREEHQPEWECEP